MCVILRAGELCQGAAGCGITMGPQSRPKNSANAVPDGAWFSKGDLIARVMGPQVADRRNTRLARFLHYYFATDRCQCEGLRRNAFHLTGPHRKEVRNDRAARTD